MPSCLPNEENNIFIEHLHYVFFTVHKTLGSAGIGPFIHSFIPEGHSALGAVWSLWDIVVVVIMAPDDNDNHSSYGKSTAQGSPV